MNARIPFLSLALSLVLALLATSAFATVGGTAGDTDSAQVDCVKDLFRFGVHHGLVRHHAMATVNQGDLTDFWAQAIGGRLAFHTATYKGFQAGISGIFLYNVGSSDLTAPDPTTGRLSRFERQLFDLEDPANKYDLDRLDELWIRYSYGSSSITYGKQEINTPLVNAQDSRMKPSVLGGVWAEIKEVPKLELSLGWFTKASPRSTTHWMPIAEAIGVYGKGRNPDGTASGYAGHLETRGLGIMGATYAVNEHLSLQAWDYLIENTQNTVFAQADYQKGLWFGGLQYVRQDAVANGGNEDWTMAYYHPGQSANLFGGQLGLQQGKWKAWLNYQHGLNTGRFVFPRELGTSMLYTTMSRGLLEGQGGMNSLVLRVQHSPLKDKSLVMRVDLARTLTSGRHNTALNKYGIASLHQVNARATYHFKGILKGAKVQALYVFKQNLPGEPHEPAVVYNESDLHHFNLITNIYF